MNIYLRHPIHGTKVAIIEMEAENDEMNGWVRFDPEEKIKQPVAKPEIADEIPINELKPRRRRKQD